MKKTHTVAIVHVMSIHIGGFIFHHMILDTLFEVPRMSTKAEFNSIRP